jgi:hypothetical protein
MNWGKRSKEIKQAKPNIFWNLFCLLEQEINNKNESAWVE